MFSCLCKNVKSHLLNLAHLIRYVSKFLSVEENRPTFRNIELLFVLFRTLLQNANLQEVCKFSDWVETRNFALNSSGRFHFDQWHRQPTDLIKGIQTIYCLLSAEMKPINRTISNTAQTVRHAGTHRSTKCSQTICYGDLVWVTFPICILILSYNLRWGIPSSFFFEVFLQIIYIYTLLKLATCVTLLHLITIQLLGETCTLCVCPLLCPVVFQLSSVQREWLYSILNYITAPFFGLFTK